MTVNVSYHPVSHSYGLTIYRRLLVAMLLGGAFLFSGCKDLRQKHLDLAESMINCLDEMVEQLGEVTSPESLHSALPEFQATVDRLKEIGKDAVRLEREEGKVMFDQDTEKSLKSRMKEKMVAMVSEIQRIRKIPGINPSDMMAIGQTLMSFQSIKSGDYLSPPPPDPSDSNRPAPPPPDPSGSNKSAPPPPSFSGRGGSAPPPPPAQAGDGLKQKHQKILESSLSCWDDMVGQLRGVNSPESLQSALPGFQAAADRLKEAAKEEMRLQHEAGIFQPPDPETIKSYLSRIIEKATALKAELQRIQNIPGINLNDLMSIGQSLQSIIPGGNLAPPPMGFNASNGPVPPPPGFGGQGGPVPSPSMFAGPGGPPPAPPGFTAPGASPPPGAGPPQNVSPPQTPNERQTRPFTPEGFRQDLNDLQSNWPPDRQNALEHLLKAKPEDAKSKELRKQIAQAIKETAFNNRDTLENRRLAVQGLVIWGGKYCVPFLIQLLDDQSFFTHVQKTLYQALTDLHDDRAIEPVAKKIYGAPFAFEEALHCLEVFGPKAEDALLKRFPPQYPQVTKKLVQFLARYGTKKSLPKLRALQKHPSAPLLQPELDQALEDLSQRTKTGK